MKEEIERRLKTLLPANSTQICFTTYLPLASSVRQNDWERNVDRVELHKQLVSMELNEDSTSIIKKSEKAETLGRGHKSGSRVLLEDFIVNLDLENYFSIGRVLFQKGYLNKVSASNFLKEMSSIVDGSQLSESQIEMALQSWEKCD